MTVDLKSVVPVAQMAGEDAEDTQLLSKTFAEASSYLRGFKWCRNIKEVFFGCGVGGVVAVFLFRIEPSGSADEWLWVVSGDLPSAYLVTDEAPTPLAALAIYCDLMDDWVAAVRSNRLLNEVFPVDAAATMANASALESRLNLLRKEIIPALAPASEA